MSNQYDQTKQKGTMYSCTIYTMLNIIKYDFGVEVKDGMIFKIVAYMEGIGALMPKGAYFSVIYPAMCKLISMKTGLNLKVKTSYISRGLDEESMWGLGAKKLSSLSIALASKDKWINVADMKTIADSNKGSGHNHAVKKYNNKNRWRIVESWGGISYNTSLEALREGVLLGIYYDKARTLVAADERTAKLQKRCIKRAKDKGFLVWEDYMKIK